MKSSWDIKLPLFAMDADITIYWPAVRPFWEESFHHPEK